MIRQPNGRQDDEHPEQLPWDDPDEGPDNKDTLGRIEDDRPLVPDDPQREFVEPD